MITVKLLTRLDIRALMQQERLSMADLSFLHVAVKLAGPLDPRLLTYLSAAYFEEINIPGLYVPCMRVMASESIEMWSIVIQKLMSAEIEVSAAYGKAIRQVLINEGLESLL